MKLTKPFPSDLPYLDASLFKEVKARFVGIALPIDNFAYPRIDHHLGAKDARLVSAIEYGSLDANPVQCGLNYCILLRVNCPTKFMPGSAHYAFSGTTDNIAMLKSRWRPIVSRT